MRNVDSDASVSTAVAVGGPLNRSASAPLGGVASVLGGAMMCGGGEMRSGSVVYLIRK